VRNKNKPEFVKIETINRINYLIAALILISCLISTTSNDIYQDGEWANAQWLGQDIITLVIALPLLIISNYKSVKTENKKWLILNTGILLYLAYTYSFYMFAAKLTFLYLFHVQIYGLSIFGLALSFIFIFNQNVSFKFHLAKLKMTIIVYLSLIALMLSFLWLSDIFAHLTNPEHQSDTPNGEAPLIIYSLDLGLIIPLMFISAYSLYKQYNWGYIIGGFVLTKTSILGFALMAMALSMYVQKLNPEYFLILLWCFIGGFGTILTILYFKNLKIHDSAEHKII